MDAFLYAALRAHPWMQVLFDPHGSYLPNVSSANPGKRIRFAQSPVLDSYPDQFEPYTAFGCDMRSMYQGTLFRFPLRSPALAQQSRISKQVRDLDDTRCRFSGANVEPCPCIASLQDAMNTCLLCSSGRC